MQGPAELVPLSFRSSLLTLLSLGPHSLFRPPTQPQPAFRLLCSPCSVKDQLPAANPTPAAPTTLGSEQPSFLHHHCCQSRREQPGARTGWAPSLMQPRKVNAFAFVGRKEMFLQPCLLCHSPTVLLSLEVLGTFPHLVNK